MMLVEACKEVEHSFEYKRLVDIYTLYKLMNCPGRVSSRDQRQDMNISKQRDTWPRVNRRAFSAPGGGQGTVRFPL